jgi:hypothetical protein
MSEALDTFLLDFPPEMGVLLKEAQVWVRAVLPDAYEHLSVAYQMVMYKVSEPSKEWVIYLAPYTKHVNLGFMTGSTLPDPEKLLKGTGKTLRHIKIRKSADLEKNGVRDLVLQAWTVATQPPQY